MPVSSMFKVGALSIQTKWLLAEQKKQINVENVKKYIKTITFEII